MKTKNNWHLLGILVLVFFTAMACQLDQRETTDSPSNYHYFVDGKSVTENEFTSIMDDAELYIDVTDESLNAQAFTSEAALADYSQQDTMDINSIKAAEAKIIASVEKAKAAEIYEATGEVPEIDYPKVASAGSKFGMDPVYFAINVTGGTGDIIWDIFFANSVPLAGPVPTVGTKYNDKFSGFAIAGIGGTVILYDGLFFRKKMCTIKTKGFNAIIFEGPLANFNDRISSLITL